MAQIKYPIGIQTFSIIREEGYVYVDKTGYLHRMLDSGSKYVFLSRPRRFGKSLFLSTVAEFFSGNRRLFEGLEIAEHEYEWVRHPVLRLDFSCSNYNSPDALQKHLDFHYSKWERALGIKSGESAGPGLRFKAIIEESYRQSGRGVVILIDEYDKALIDTVDNPTLQEKYRGDLKAVFGNLKSQDAHIRFAMLTGVTKFGHLNIFSDLNNLEDISLKDAYGGICGITAEELHRHLGSGVRNFAEKQHIPIDDAYELLRINYDGYHFCPENAPDIHNPFSIISALKDGRISNYWFQTGTPNFLVKLIKAKGIALERLGNTELDEDKINSISLDYRANLYPVLYQAGYLTIKGYRPHLNRIKLGFPNREVEMGFFNQLMQTYIPDSENNEGLSVFDFYDDIVDGNAESFMVRLQALFSDFNQDGFNHIGIEQHYQDIVFLLMKMLGFHTHIEYKTASGRIDLLVKTSKYIYIFEFKMNKSAGEAIEQIESKDYLLPFGADSRKIIEIGANFSDKIRSIDEWIIKEIPNNTLT